MTRTTIVVPCYNEAERFDAAAFARCLREQPDVSFILVNDGSKDATLATLEAFAADHSTRVQVIDQNPNAGKAEAVRRGMLLAIASGAELAGFWDADLATPLEAVPEFVEAFDEHPETELLLGARVALLGREIERKPVRHYLGRVFATCASLVLKLPVYDTQCGAKLLRCNEGTHRLFEEPFGSRWIFDVEMLARYLSNRETPHRIRELPLERWTDIEGSKVKPLDFFRAFGELIRVHRKYSLNGVHQGFLYAGAGAVGTVAHYAILTAFVQLIGMSPVLATAIGAGVGALINYMLNYHVTFLSDASHFRTLPRFLLVAGLAMGLNAGGMWIAIEIFGINYLVAQVFCTLLVLVAGFLLNKTWTFGSSEATRSQR